MENNFQVGTKVVINRLHGTVEAITDEGYDVRSTKGQLFSGFTTEFMESYAKPIDEHNRTELIVVQISVMAQSHVSVQQVQDWFEHLVEKEARGFYKKLMVTAVTAYRPL